MPTINTTPLFTPFKSPNLTLKNRIIMSPMTRSQSPNGIPTEKVCQYYKARAEGGVGLIITEGTFINAYAGKSDEMSCVSAVPNIYEPKAIAGWQKVVESVHDAGAKIFLQLWHVGGVRQTGLQPSPNQVGFAPSAVVHPNAKKNEPAVEMSLQDIQNTINDYIQAAVVAQSIGFDGVELHGAHGYLIDQFFWNKTNKRSDQYGNQSMENKTRFACEIIAGIKNKLGANFPVSLRFSQWKIGAYTDTIFNNQQDLKDFLNPLVQAGVDLFHCSTLRFYDAAFEDSKQSLAALTQALSGKPTIAVGSLGMDVDVAKTNMGVTTTNLSKNATDGIAQACDSLEQHEFDLVAVGRSLIADPDWPLKIRQGDFDKLIKYDKSMLTKYT